MKNKTYQILGIFGYYIKIVNINEALVDFEIYKKIFRFRSF